MDADQHQMLERLVAEVAILRSAVALLLAANLSPDGLRAYRNDLPSPTDLSEPSAETLRQFSDDLDLGVALQRRFPKKR